MLKHLLITYLLISALHVHALPKMFHKKRNSINVETKNGIFKIPITEETTIGSIKRKIHHLEGTPVKQQTLKTRKLFIQTSLKDYERLGTNTKRLSLCITKK